MSRLALAPRCTARATAVRTLAASLGMTGTGTTDPAGVAGRMAWDAYAAGEYPRPVLSDAVDAEQVRPDLAADVWHAAAGATILGPGCDCAPPAVHRDALVELARRIGESA